MYTVAFAAAVVTVKKLKLSCRCKGRGGLVIPVQAPLRRLEMSNAAIDVCSTAERHVTEGERMTRSKGVHILMGLSTKEGRMLAGYNERSQIKSA